MTDTHYNTEQFSRKGQEGFTLLEMIVTLILVGILAATAGLGIVSSVTGYLMAQENGTIAQKAELTLRRLALELQRAEDIPNCGTDYVVLSYEESEVINYCSIGLVDGDIKMGTTGSAPDAGDDTLVGDVAGFEMTYHKYKNEGTTTWPEWTTADYFEELGFITITLTLNRNDGDTQRFTTSLHMGPLAT